MLTQADEPSLPQPMAMTHVHYYRQERAAIQAWYVKVLGANPSWRA